MKSPEPQVESPALQVSEPQVISPEAHIGLSEPSTELLESQELDDVSPESQMLFSEAPPTLSEPTTSSPEKTTSELIGKPHSPLSPGSLVVEIGSPMTSTSMLNESHVSHMQQDDLREQNKIVTHKVDQQLTGGDSEVIEHRTVSPDTAPLDISIKERHGSIASEVSEQSYDREISSNLQDPPIITSEADTGVTCESSNERQYDVDSASAAIDVSGSNNRPVISDSNAGEELETLPATESNSMLPVPGYNDEDKETISEQDMAPEDVPGQVYVEASNEDMDVSSSFYKQDIENNDNQVVTQSVNFENAPPTKGESEEVCTSVSQSMETSEAMTSKNMLDSVCHDVDPELPSSAVGPDENKEPSQVCEMYTDQTVDSQGTNDNYSQQQITPALCDEHMTTDKLPVERLETNTFLSEHIASTSSVAKSPVIELQSDLNVMDEASAFSNSVCSLGSKMETPAELLDTTKISVLKESGVEKEFTEPEVATNAEITSHFEVEQIVEKVIAAEDTEIMPSAKDPSVSTVTLSTAAGLGEVSLEEISSPVHEMYSDPNESGDKTAAEIPETANNRLSDNEAEACTVTSEVIGMSDFNRADSDVDAAAIQSTKFDLDVKESSSVEPEVCGMGPGGSGLDDKTTLDQDNQVTESAPAMPEYNIPISAPQYSSEHVKSSEDIVPPVNVIQDSFISSDISLTTADTMSTTDEITASVSNDDGSKSLSKQSDNETASSATEEMQVDVEETSTDKNLIDNSKEDLSSVALPDQPTGESDDSGDSSDSSSSDSDSDDNQSSSSSSSQEDQVETTIVTEIDTPSHVPTAEDDATVTMDSGLNDAISDANVVKEQQQGEDDKKESEIIPAIVETIPEVNQQEVPRDSPKDQPQETVLKSHTMKMRPRPIPADTTHTWESLGHESNTDGKLNKQDDDNAATVNKQTPTSQMMSVGNYMEQHVSQPSQEISGGLVQRSGVIVPQHETHSKEEELQRVLQAYKKAYAPSTIGMPVTTSVVATTASIANFGTILNQPRQSTSDSSADKNEHTRASNTAEKASARSLQQLIVGDGRASSPHDTSGIISIGPSADNVESPSYKIKDKVCVCVCVCACVRACVRVCVCVCLLYAFVC